MPPSETPSNPPLSSGPAHPAADSGSVAVQEPETPVRDESPVSGGSGLRSSSRYVDYDTHELLERISQYEDERRWQRIREGIWISILAHIAFFALLYTIPRYVLHQNALIDPIQAIKDRKDLTYLDELPDALKEIQKLKPKAPALKPSETQVDKKTLDALKSLEKVRPKPAPPAPAPEQHADATPPPAPVAQPQPQPQPVTPPSTAAPVANPPLALETPRPASVPARPNFSLNTGNPADQLRQAMRDSGQPGAGAGVRGPSPGKDPRGGGGARILSDTQGVNFDPWLQKAVRETYRTWDPLIPDEVLPPINKRGEVAIVFTVLPNGRLQPVSMHLVGRSGDVALDRAAWGAIESADYPALPQEFHGPNLQIEFVFDY